MTFKWAIHTEYVLALKIRHCLKCLSKSGISFSLRDLVLEHCVIRKMLQKMKDESALFNNVYLMQAYNN